MLDSHAATRYSFCMQQQSNLNSFLLLGVLFIGLTIGVLATRGSQEVRTGASSATITILSPGTDQIVSGVTVVKAKAQTLQQENQLLALLRIDGQDMQEMRVDQVDSQTVSALAAFNTASVSSGNHALEVVLLDTSTSPRAQIGSTSIPITITNP